MSTCARVALAIALCLLALVGLGLAKSSAAHPASGQACPSRPREAQPVGFVFSPGLDQHRSWIEFVVSEPDATSFTLCLDGQLWEAGIGETPQNGRVLVNVKTTFVDAEWLLGQLDEFQDASRWQLGYTTYSLEQL